MYEKAQLDQLILSFVCEMRGGGSFGGWVSVWVGLVICGVGGSTAKSKQQKGYITHGMFVFPIYFVLPTWGVGISSLCWLRATWRCSGGVPDIFIDDGIKGDDAASDSQLSLFYIRTSLKKSACGLSLPSPPTLADVF